jgi:ABC-2 type transport system ATP-binding protein
VDWLERLTELIHCRAVSKSYASRKVLTCVDLILQSGICALLGANGAGKSTLLRLLSGLEKPDSGSVLIDGLTYQNQGVEIRRNLGILPETLGLFESLTVLENLCAIGPIYGLTKRETETRAADLLDLLHLAPARHTRARDCSFGMRKKSALGMALLHNPRILLLDEPFEGVDPASANDIQVVLRQLSSNGATILLTSHILSTVQQLATRVIILHGGQVESDSAPSASDESVEDCYFRITGTEKPEVPNWLRS